MIYSYDKQALEMIYTSNTMHMTVKHWKQTKQSFKALFTGWMFRFLNMMFADFQCYTWIMHVMVRENQSAIWYHKIV